MLGPAELPPHIRRVVEAYCCKREAEAEERGYLRGKAEGMAQVNEGLKALSILISPSLRMSQTITSDTMSAMFPVATPADVPGQMLSHGGTDAHINFDLDEVLDDLFGTKWSDIDRQELLRYVMAAVQESLVARGKDPQPVMDILRRMATDDEGFDSAIEGGEKFKQWLSWQAVPLRNPRGDFRFKAVDSETGNQLFGDKAIEVMRRHNRDKFAFNPGAADPAMRGHPYDKSGPATLDEHTEAYRNAKDCINGVRERLNSGEKITPGDMVEWADHLALMGGHELRAIRDHLMQSLTKRIRAGRTKGDRAEGIRQALKRLREAVVEISTAVLKHAESQGHDITHDKAVEAAKEIGESVPEDEDILLSDDLMLPDMMTLSDDDGEMSVEQPRGD